MSDTSHSDRGPHPILAGLSMGVLLFSLTLCTGILVFAPVLARQLDIGPAAGQTWTPPPPTPLPADTPQPVETPTPEPTPATGQVFPTPPGEHTFAVGDVAVNVNRGPVNLRQSPGYLNKPASDRVALAPAGDRVEIVGGPVLADELIWWQVRWQGREGWMAEISASGVRILAPAPNQ